MFFFLACVLFFYFFLFYFFSGARLGEGIKLPLIGGIDNHYPTEEPNLTHVESSSQGEPRHDFCHLGRHIR